MKSKYQLRKQYRRIVNIHNYAIHQAQKAHDSERLEALDARGARIDKAYSRLRAQIGL